MRAGMAEGPLKLRAEDIEDLIVVSACLQDAVTRGSEFVYQAKQRRFAAIFSRFLWEDSQGGGRDANRRVRAGLHFDGVLAVRFRALQRSTDEVLELLSVTGQRGEDGAAVINMEFAGGAAIQLEVECVACYLSDIGQPWRVKRRPQHKPDIE